MRACAAACRVGEGRNVGRGDVETWVVGRKFVRVRPGTNGACRRSRVATTSVRLGVVCLVYVFVPEIIQALFLHRHAYGSTTHIMHSLVRILYGAREPPKTHNIYIEDSKNTFETEIESRAVVTTVTYDKEGCG